MFQALMDLFSIKQQSGKHASRYDGPCNPQSRIAVVSCFGGDAVVAIDSSGDYGGLILAIKKEEDNPICVWIATRRMKFCQKN